MAKVHRIGDEVETGDGFTLKKVGAGIWRVSCSQCEALVINGMRTHEQGCYNSRKYKNQEDTNNDE